MSWLIMYFSEQEDAEAFLASERYGELCQQPDDALVTLSHGSENEMDHEYVVLGELKPEISVPEDFEKQEEWLCTVEEEADACFSYITDKARDQIKLDF